MNPVVVGLDPGRNGPDPLDPAFGSGRRLSAMLGVGPDEYLRRIDRVNLHPSERLPGDDRAAGANLLPILRGRRVVVLGRRVAEALDVTDDWFRWRVAPGGFVAACSPHPSGLSRWWNDAGNVLAAGAFWSRVLRPTVYVEGPDGSGKSTLVGVISADRGPGPSTVETEGPPATWVECLRRIDARVAPGLLCDRSSGLVSELVYGPVLRGGVLAPGGEDELWRLVGSVKHAVVFVHCRPDRLEPRARPGEDPEHLRAVGANLGRIRDRYDEVMLRVASMGARVVRYDRSPRSLEEVLACAE